MPFDMPEVEQTRAALVELPDQWRQAVEEPLVQEARRRATIRRLGELEAETGAALMEALAGEVPDLDKALSLQTKLAALDGIRAKLPAPGVTDDVAQEAVQLASADLWRMQVHLEHELPPAAPRYEQELQEWVQSQRTFRPGVPADPPVATEADLRAAEAWRGLLRDVESWRKRVGDWNSGAARIGPHALLGILANAARLLREGEALRERSRDVDRLIREANAARQRLKTKTG